MAQNTLELKFEIENEARSTADRGDPFSNPIYVAERRLFRILDIYLRGSFVLAVVVPILLIALYFGFIASNQYTSEVRAVIRLVDVSHAGGSVNFSSPSAANRTTLTNSGSGGTAAGLGGLTGFGWTNFFGTAPREAYLVQEYVKSDAVITDLKKIIELENIFRGDADFWARFPDTGTEQDFLEYWRSHIEVSVEGPAGVLIMRLRTFSAEQSRILLQHVIQASGVMVNRLQRQVLEHSLQHAQSEANSALSAYHRAQEELTRYRSEHQILNPYTTLQSSSQLLLVALSERAKVQSDLRFMKEMMSERAPSVQALEEKLRSLNEQIQAIQKELTGSSQSQKSLAEFIARYEELELRRILSERLLASVYDQVEKSRLRLEQQKIFIEPFIGPTQIGSSDYPRRVMDTVIFSTFLFMLWSIHGLIILAIRDQLI